MVKFNFDIPKLNKRSWITLIILLIFLVSIPAGIYLSQKTQIFKPRAANTPSPLSQLTNDLQGAKNRNDLNAMIDISERRKFLLLQKIKSDPEGFLNEATLYQTRNSYPDQIRDNIERFVQPQGRISVLHKDYRDNNSEDKFLFTENNPSGPVTESNIYDLYIAGQVRSDQIAHLKGNYNVSGIALGKKMAARDRDIPLTTTQKFSNQEIKDYTTGSKKIAVILVDFRINPNTPNFTKDQIRELMFGDDTSLANFFRTSSYNRLNITGDVFGFYKVHGAYDYIDGCILNTTNPLFDGKLYVTSLTAFSDAVVKDNLDINKYDLISFVFANNTVCGIESAGTIGTTKRLNKEVGVSYIFNPRSLLHYAHEIGHNFFLQHSLLLDCGDKPIDDYNRCQVEEYGDYLSTPMGGYRGYDPLDSTQYFNSSEKKQLFWLEDTKFQNVYRSGTHTIKTLDALTSSPQVLVIPKNDTGQKYFVEYRINDAFQKFDGRNDGAVFIRIDDENIVPIKKADGNNWDYPFRALVNPYPRTDNPMISIGLTQSPFSNPSFYDHINNIRITLTRSSSIEAEIQVDFGDIPSSSPVVITPPAGVGTAVSLAPKPTAPEYICDKLGSNEVKIKWLSVTNAYKYKLFIDDLSDSRELTLDDPNCLNSNLEDKCFNTTIPDTRENPIIAFIRKGVKYKIWTQAYDLGNNLSEPSDKVDMVCGDLIPRIVGSRKIIDFPCYGLRPYPKPFPIRKKDSKQCFYSGSSCYDDDRYDLDFSCDTEHLYTKEDFSVKSQSLSDLGLISQPQFTNASCTNGVLDISWSGSGPSYELRGGMNLTQDQILDGSTWENNHPTSDDIVGRDLTSTSFSQAVGANNQSYTIWIQSKNQYGVSDRVFYPDPVRCAAPPAQTIQKTVSSITVNNQSLDLSGSSLSLTLSSSETNIPMQVSFSNGDSIVAGIRFIYTPPPQSVSPSSLSATCSNGILTASWPKVNDALNYELRGGKGLTDRPDDNAWENFPEADKIIGRQLTNCSSTTCTYTATVQPNGSYFLWVHSRTNSGVSDATKLPSPVTCSGSASNPQPPPQQPPQLSNLVQFTKAECTNGVLSISWSGGGPKYELRGGMNLTKTQILDGTWEASHPTSNDLVGRNLTQTSFSKSVGSNNQSYTIWIHSRSNTGVLSDRVFYPERIYCR